MTFHGHGNYKNRVKKKERNVKKKLKDTKFKVIKNAFCSYSLYFVVTITTASKSSQRQFKIHRILSKLCNRRSEIKYLDKLLYTREQLKLIKR